MVLKHTIHDTCSIIILSTIGIFSGFQKRALASYHAVHIRMLCYTVCSNVCRLYRATIQSPRRFPLPLQTLIYKSATILLARRILWL